MRSTGQFASITQFAEQYKVRVKKDECGHEIVPGRLGHIFDGYTDRLGLCLMLETGQQWTWAKKKLTAAGIVIRQDGDVEGTALLDPMNAKQAHLAIKLAGIRIRKTRNLTLEQRKAIGERLQKAKKAPTVV